MKFLLAVGALVGVWFAAKSCFCIDQTGNAPSPFEKAAPLKALFAASVSPTHVSTLPAIVSQPIVSNPTVAPSYTPKTAFDILRLAASRQ